MSNSLRRETDAFELKVFREEAKLKNTNFMSAYNAIARTIKGNSLTRKEADQLIALINECVKQKGTT